MQHLSRTLFTLFFIVALGVCQGWAQERSLKFSYVEVNNDDNYSVNSNGGTIQIDYNDPDQVLRIIQAQLLYNESTTEEEKDYTIDLQLTYTDADDEETEETVEDFASIQSSSLTSSNSFLVTGIESGLEYSDFPIKIKAILYESGGDDEIASTAEITIEIAPDPNAVKNNIICFEPFSTECNVKHFTQTGSANNVVLYGSTPTGGGTAPVTYSYQWQIKYDNGNWSDIPGANSKNYTLVSTTANETYIRRKVSSGAYPDGTLSEAITVHVLLCDQPGEGICADQFFYNCVRGQGYETRPIQGAYFSHVEEEIHKCVWELKEEGGEWDDVAQTMTVQDFWEYHYGSFTKKTDRVTDVYYARRKIEWRNCLGGFCGEWHLSSASNEVRFVFSECPDPNSITHTLSGPSTVKCTDNNLEYQLAMSVDCGIANVQWSIPSGWQFITPGSGAAVRNVRVNPFNGFSANGGTVKVRITYVDGKVFEKQMTVTGQLAPTFTANSYSLDHLLCQGQPVTFTVTAAGGTAPYTCEWVGPNILFTPSVSGNSFSAVVSPIQPGGVHTLKAIISDYNGCKVHSNEPTFHDGTALWVTREPFGVGNSIPAANIYVVDTDYAETVEANIVSEQLGNIYYVGKESEGVFKLTTIQWDGSASRWRNFTFPKDRAVSVSSPSIGILEPTDGNRTIFYVGLDKKLRSIKSINGYQNEFNYVNNWTAETIYSVTNNVKSIMFVNAQYVIYKNLSNQVYAYNLVAGANILVDGANVQGIRAVVRDNNVFYVKDGRLFGKKVAEATILTLKYKGPVDHRLALYNTDLEIYGNTLFFVGDDKFIRQMNINDFTINKTVSPSDPTAIQCNGFFSVNKNTGVIYFTGNIFVSATMNQLFYHGTLGWRTKQISVGNQAGAVKFRTPNAFFVDVNNLIKFTYFAVVSCQPGVQRMAADEDFNNQDHIEGYKATPLSYGEIELSVYPSPANNTLSVNIGGMDYSSLTFVLTDLAGKEVKQWQKEDGSNLNVTDVPTGIYLLSIYDHDVLFGIEKIVINK